MTISQWYESIRRVIKNPGIRAQLRLQRSGEEIVSAELAGQTREYFEKQLINKFTERERRHLWNGIFDPLEKIVKRKLRGTGGMISQRTANTIIKDLKSIPVSKVEKAVRNRINRIKRIKERRVEEERRAYEPKVFDYKYITRGVTIGGAEMTSLGPPISFGYGVYRKE